MRILKVFIGLSISMLVVSCDQLGFSTDIPISTDLSQEYTFTEDGAFDVSKSDNFFEEDNLDDILGNIKTLNIDSVTLNIDSTSIEINDSLPSIDGILELSVDSISVSESITGSIKSLINSPNRKLNISTDDIIAISVLLTEKANNNENTIWAYRFSGISQGAPFTIYFRLKFFGSIETFPEQII